MAKKKTEASERKPQTTAKKKATPKKAVSGGASAKPAGAAKSAKTSAGKSSKPAAGAAPKQTPMVDTSLAAQTAAQMLAAGLGRRAAQSQNQTGEERREGSLIRQLKADLNKGHAQNVSNVLDKSAPAGQKRSGGAQPFGQKQTGHHQTFGPDVTRSGVPRRTSG